MTQEYGNNIGVFEELISIACVIFMHFDEFNITL